MIIKLIKITFGLVVFLTFTKGYAIEDSIESLYSPSDEVIELVDANMTDILTDDSIWLVEFYNNWCGHCQRFVPTWQEVARSLKEYEPYVKVGAINCATQNECQNFRISQTPTIRLYNPRSPQQWAEMLSNGGAAYFTQEAINNLNMYFPEASFRSYNSNSGPSYQAGPAYNSWDSRPQFVDVNAVSSQTTTSTIPPTIINKNPVNKPDKVHQTDIERAIKYALTQEIPLKSILQMSELRALYTFLDTLVKHAPNLKENTKNFLISLREWPTAMGFRSISNQELKEKLEELEEYYQPFDNTGDDFVYCKGSASNYRGYPCSLWTLFHALTAKAALKEDSHMHYHGSSSVAMAILNYVQNFFSCEDCSRHFVSGVNNLGYFPSTNNDAVIWLWNLHNMANSRLSGDLTEDPQHPKIQWPSADNCPDCNMYQRSYNMMGGLTLEKVWNVAQVREYIKRIYAEGNVERNPEKRDSTPSLDEKLRSRTTCLKSLPSSLQDKCTSVFTYQQECSKPKL